MLILARSLGELSFEKLMEVYAEGNLENGAQFWPEEPEGRRLQLAEQGFYQYLQEDFFRTPGAVYAVWQENGEYVSALRLEPYQDGLLLEALETAPNKRRMGYAKKLIQAVLIYLKCRGVGKVYSHVGKRNTASQAAHAACGFQKALDYAVYVDGSVSRRSDTLCVCWE